MGTAVILGRSYQTVVMPDGKEWMAENLAWTGAGQWWNNGASDDGDGRYYNLYGTVNPNTGVDAADPLAVKAALSGTGWRIPTQADTLALDAACAAIVGSANVGGALKVTTEWAAPNTGALNQFGFNSRPTGRHYYATWEYKDTYGWFGLDAVSPVRTAATRHDTADFFPDVDQSAGGIGTSFRVPYRLVREVPQFTGARVNALAAPATPAAGTIGTASILGTTYPTVVMPDGKEWTTQNVTYAPLQTSSDSQGSLFTQSGANSLHALLESTGWRVPTNSEWYAMGAALSGASWVLGSDTTSSGNNVPFDGRFTGGVGAELKDPAGWTSPYNVPPYTGANSYGFSARMHDSTVQKIAIWRCYMPSPGIYSPVWFVADSSDSFLHENGWGSSSGVHVRLVRDPTPVPTWRNAPEVHVARNRENGTTRNVEILGGTYPTVVMPDGKEWMAANLAWSGAGQWWNNGAGDDGEGRYYTLTEARTTLGPALAGSGWRLPTPDEVSALAGSVGGLPVAGKALKTTGTAHWNTNTGATNSFGFGLRGSGRYWGVWQLKKAIVVHWLAAGGAPYFGADDNASPLWFGSDPSHTTWRAPVRLVRDNPRIWRKASRIFKAEGTVDPGTPGTATILGTTYPTVIMPDGKEWMLANLDYSGLGELSGGGAAFGRLYSWADCDTLRSLLTGGWRIPEYRVGTSTTEWQDLFEAAGITGTEGRLRNPSLTYWAAASNGENLYGFDLRGGGIEGGSLVTVVGRYWYLNNPGVPTGEYLSTNWVYNRITTGGGYVSVNYSKCSLRLVRDIPAGARAWREVTK